MKMPTITEQAVSFLEEKLSGLDYRGYLKLEGEIEEKNPIIGKLISKIGNEGFGSSVGREVSAIRIYELIKIQMELDEQTQL